jgi:hypothetical protein
MHLAADCPTVSTWRHRTDGLGAHYFDSTKARQWIESYNQTGDAEALNRLLEHVTPLAQSILQYRSTLKYAEEGDLLSRIYCKLWRSLRLYDASKGSPFSFCAMVIQSVSRSAVGEVWTRNERFCEIDEASAVSPYADPLSSTQELAEIEYRIRRLRTSCTRRAELSAQRWYVESFIDSGFRLRRHEAADAMMQVYGLDHARSRQLFDLTMVAIRRELISERRLAPVAPVTLRGTKSQALIRYAKILSAQEFTRLAVLLKDVAPSVVYTVKPQNFCAIRNGSAGATMENLGLVLWGSPTDRRLL